MRLAVLASTALLACLPSLAHAQDPATDTQARETGWSGSGELGLAVASGNSRSESANAKLALERESERWRHTLEAAALRSRGEVSGDFDGDGVADERLELTANRYALGGSSAYRFDPRNYVVGSLRYEHDDFAPYDYQATAAIGYGHHFIDNDRTELLGEIGPGFRQARQADTGEVERGAIVRGRIDVRHALTDSTELVDTLLVEAGSDNTFIQNDLGIAVAMNEAFALKAGLQVRHNTDVDQASGVEKTDTLTTVNLVYNFR